MVKAALFDFDYTIVNRDTFATFVRYLFEQEPWRKSLLVIFAPLLLLLGSHKRTKMTRNVMLIWISTLGTTSRRLAEYQQGFVPYFFDQAGGKAYSEALSALREHQRQGDDVFIVSGAAQWLLEPMCTYLGIDAVTILGTTTKRTLGGMTTDFHCYKQNKVIKLSESGVPHTYQFLTGYSDSAADIPMLKLCHSVHVINPKPSCLQKFDGVFGQQMALHQCSRCALVNLV